jgi:O-antigen/teichoic acid export membrane protein
MSNIRRQSIISSLVIYFGFGVGMVNTYFFGRNFTPAQYGLTSIFMAIATMMMAFAALAMPPYITKFYHYYNDRLPVRRNDMITWALLVSVLGFILVMIAGWLFKNLVIRKFGEHSPELLQYYYWIFPMGLGLTIYTVLEAYTWNIGKAVLTSFLKEVLWRLLTTVLIVLFIFEAIKNFDVFIKLYAFGFPAIAIVLFLYLVITGKIHFTFRISKITRRYFRKILSFCLFVYSGILIFTISQVFDSIVIASVLPDGLAKAGIFGLAQIMSSVIQAPQRGIIAASITHLARAWKDKNRQRLQIIYQRSSINLLIFATGLFLLISLNYTEVILTFGLKEDYLLGLNAFLLLGLTRVVDMGTGLNAQIISTSNYWWFELVSGIILLALMLPLTLVLTRQYDIMGPAIANFISITIYNLVRIIFLWKKFRLFPFTIQSLYTVLLGAVCFTACYYLFKTIHGFPGLVLRSGVFIILYTGTVIYFRLTPDIQPVMQALGKRLGLKKKL